MDLKEQLDKIEEHFKNISVEKIEENLKKAGKGVISPCSDSDVEMI